MHAADIQHPTTQHTLRGATTMQDTPNEATKKRVLDPICHLSLPSPAKSICFVNAARDTSESNDDDSSDDEEIVFQSSRIARTLASSHPSATRFDALRNHLLISCHETGEALLWDCGRQSLVSTVCPSRAGPALSVQRWDAPGNHDFLFHTRDPEGTVTIHTLEEQSGECSERQRYETGSATFCQAAPCHGNPNLLALPTHDDATASVVDLRDPTPIAVLPSKNRGMLTSLALANCGSGERPILACGMENGSVLFHDFTAGVTTKAEYSLTKDPILTLDLAPSSSTTAASVVAVAGMAVDTVEVAEMEAENQGRVALLKASIPTGVRDSWNIRLRARMSTCRVGETSFGKPGVSTCRFRPGDSRLVAVGGWDMRVRLFDRSNGNPMGILRGHDGSVSAVDWSPDAMTSGLIATAGGEDNHVSFWKCFGNDNL